MATSVHDLCPASITHAQSSFFYGMWQCQPTTFMHLQSFYVYVPLRDANVTLHLAPLRPPVAFFFYIFSFPTQALMAEMCAWQPFTHQTEIYNPSTTSTWTLSSDWVCSLRLSLHILRTFSMQWMNTLLPTNIFSGLHSFTFLLPTPHYRTFCEHFRDYSNRTVSVVNIHVTIFPYFLI